MIRSERLCSSSPPTTPTSTINIATNNSEGNNCGNMMDQSNQHIVHAGFLIKSPPEKRIWKTKWRRRWFVLKLSGQIPGQYVLEYYTDPTCKKLKGQIDLDQCEQVDAGLQLEIRKQNYDNMFDLRTSKRTYYLVAGSEDEMNKWVECICSVCGLKMEAIQNELALLPQLEMHGGGGVEERYSPQPSQTEQQQPSQNHQQQQQSTSESSLSTLNYIPISECYTGKPSSSNQPMPMSSSPPPRPPKPPALQQFGKSQSSLALWPQDSQNQQNHSPTKVLPPMALSSNLPPPVPKSSSTLANNNNNWLIRNNPNSGYNNNNNRSFYLNSSKSSSSSSSSSATNNHHLHNNNNNNNHHQNHHQYNFYDTWHSHSKRPDFLSPPQVNRDLKPNRPIQRRILEQQNQNQPQKTVPSGNIPSIKGDSQSVNPMFMVQQFKRANDNSKPTMSNNNNNRHTLPRPLITSYTLRNSQNKANRFNTNDDNYCHLAHCEQPKNIEDCERQYLDLDLDSESNNNNNSNSNSPRTMQNFSENAPASTAFFSMNSTTSSAAVVPNNENSNSPIHSTNWNNNVPNVINVHHQQPDLLNDSSNNPLGNNNCLNSLNSNLNHCNNNTVGLPEPDNCGTVYKKVDFVKTKAFNETRLNVNFYRGNANSG